MNRRLLQKVIDELKTDKPDLSYIRGILETMIESLPVENVNNTNNFYQGVGIPTVIPVNLDEESASLDNIARMKLEEVKKLNLG